MSVAAASAAVVVVVGILFACIRRLKRRGSVPLYPVGGQSNYHLQFSNRRWKTTDAKAELNFKCARAYSTLVSGASRACSRIFVDPRNSAKLLYFAHTINNTMIRECVSFFNLYCFYNRPFQLHFNCLDTVICCRIRKISNKTDRQTLSIKYILKTLGGKKVSETARK